MDGLTVSTSQRLLDTGKTVSDMRSDEFAPKVSGSKGGESFADTLSKAIDNVDQLQKVADVKMQKLATGENKNVADVMIATEKADIALKLMVQVRNKVINAYNEIMKMQV